MDERWTTSLEDELYVRRQLHDEALSANERCCFFCDAEPPGLVFVPSEPGVIEMPVWMCPDRAANALATECARTARQAAASCCQSKETP